MTCSFFFDWLILFIFNLKKSLKDRLIMDLKFAVFNTKHKRRNTRTRNMSMENSLTLMETSPCVQKRHVENYKSERGSISYSKTGEIKFSI